jgi:hypothetical protein
VCGFPAGTQASTADLLHTRVLRDADYSMDKLMMMQASN